MGFDMIQSFTYLVRGGEVDGGVHCQYNRKLQFQNLNRLLK